jgi:hypothetical protein
VVRRPVHPRQWAILLALLSLLAVAMPAEASATAATRDDELSRDRKTAEDLYKAISADALTFERAISVPEVRKEVEHVFSRQLSDEQLQAMATQARAEADYWQLYLQGLDRAAAS